MGIIIGAAHFVLLNDESKRLVESNRSLLRGQADTEDPLDICFAQHGRYQVLPDPLPPILLSHINAGHPTFLLLEVQPTENEANKSFIESGAITRTRAPRDPVLVALQRLFQKVFQTGVCPVGPCRILYTWPLRFLQKRVLRLEIRLNDIHFHDSDPAR